VNFIIFLLDGMHKYRNQCSFEDFTLEWVKRDADLKPRRAISTRNSSSHTNVGAEGAWGWVKDWEFWIDWYG
jgi:hypothetical protein